MLGCSFCIGHPRLKRDLIQPLVKLRLCCDCVRAGSDERHFQQPLFVQEFQTANEAFAELQGQRFILHARCIRWYRDPSHGLGFDRTRVSIR